MSVVNVSVCLSPSFSVLGVGLLGWLGRGGVWVGRESLGENGWGVRRKGTDGGVRGRGTDGRRGRKRTADWRVVSLLRRVVYVSRRLR